MSLRRVIVFFYGTIFLLVAENVESTSRLRVVFDVTLMLFVAEVDAASGLANIFLIAHYTRQ